MHCAVIAILAVLFILFYLIHVSTKYVRLLTDHIPGPYNIPVLGCLPTAITINVKNVFKRGEEFKQVYGTIMKAWAFNRFFVASSDIELNEQILASTTHITKSAVYKMLHQWLGVGLLMSDGAKWRTRRKIITPTFHFTILEEFLEVFDRQSSVLIDCLARKADGKTAFNILPFMCSATLDVIAETAMGTRLYAQTDKDMTYTSAVHEMTALMAWRFIRVHLNSELVFTLMHPRKKLRQTKLIRILHDFTINVIKERRKVLENSFKSEGATGHHDQDDIGTRKRKALMDVLLQSTIEGKPLSDEDIREEVDTFMFEGHDTSATSLSFILYLMARHPQVQNKALAEIRQVYDNGNSTPYTLRNLNELKYLECVIKESLRLYPPVPFIGREINEDFKYTHSRLGDGVLPAGTEFIISVYNMLRDAELYENPTDFIPERHETNHVGGVYSFIPFSAGPRNCIGQKFAMFEIKVMLTKIVREFELLPLGPPVEPILGIVLRSDTGMQLGMRKRSALSH